MSNATKSIYDNIKTAKDLITEVMAHGLSTKTDDIVRAQDIFGNSSVGTLEALANGDGTQKYFYQIIYHIWSWETATDYYNQHSNPLYIEGREAVKECNALKAEINRKEEQIARLNGDVSEYKGAINQMMEEKVEYQREIDEKDTMIIKLKARLYDLMTAAKK